MYFVYCGGQFNIVSKLLRISQKWDKLKKWILIIYFRLIFLRFAPFICCSNNFEFTFPLFSIGIAQLSKTCYAWSVLSSEYITSVSSAEFPTRRSFPWDGLKNMWPTMLSSYLSSICCINQDSRITKLRLRK